MRERERERERGERERERKRERERGRERRKIWKELLDLSVYTYIIHMHIFYKDCSLRLI